ncbi:MAG: 3-isopropylmalate dehydrogenase [archaeon]
MTTHKVAVLAGDGIGPEIMAEAIKVLDAAGKRFDFTLNYVKADVGGTAHDKHGTALPKDTVEACEASDAILFGSVGGPQWENLPVDERIERVSLLGLRKHFDFFANLRPAIVYPALKASSPLRPDIVGEGFDIMIIRELSSGIYFGKRGITDTEAFDEMRYSKKEIERIAITACDIAMKRKKHLTCVDKSNVLSSSILWRDVVTEVAKGYPELELDYLYIDNATMQIVRRPRDFDVMVTGNMFGDILSDEAGQLTGSLGLLASASLNEEGFGMYEPAGGTAPDIAGKGIANPIAQILSAAMMLRYSFSLDDAADAIEAAVKKTLDDGIRTGDIMSEGCAKVSTVQMGDQIIKRL